ncbi:hypothetical protein [Streptomyces sp. NPDC014733]|uniref:hypothetical protein n=1 Tax=Streptomyces sp. NPDC014733 TaxID=3364885 RepID=UPI0036F93DA0
MTIIPSAAVPLRPTALVDGVEDVIAQAWTLREEVQPLAHLDAEVTVTVAPGEITTTVEVAPEAVGLLPALLKKLDNSALACTPALIRITGTMCQGRVTLHITADSSRISVGELTEITAALDAARDEATKAVAA